MRRVLLHIVFWVAYVLVLTYLNVTSGVTRFQLLPEGVFSNLYRDLSTQTVFLLVKAPFVYIALYMLNRYLRQKTKLLPVIAILIVLLVLGSIGISMLNHNVILPFLFNIHQNKYSVFSTGSLIYHALALAFVTGIAATLKLMRWQHQTQLQVITLQKQMTDAELKYLKGQINPHFLFNTLNNIYSLARKGSAATADSVLKLSKLMRFMLFEAGHARILLRNEITLIGDYIELERLRYTDRLRVDFKHELDNVNQEIAPLLLIHFVENAFKHGISETHSNSFIDINITLKASLLSVTIINSVPPTPTASNGAHIGLENVRRQLQLLYPAHRLDIVNSTDTFHLTLTIPL